MVCFNVVLCQAPVRLEECPPASARELEGQVRLVHLSSVAARNAHAVRRREHHPHALAAEQVAVLRDAHADHAQVVGGEHIGTRDRGGIVLLEAIHDVPDERGHVYPADCCRARGHRRGLASCGYHRAARIDVLCERICQRQERSLAYHSMNMETKTETKENDRTLVVLGSENVDVRRRKQGKK